MSLNTSAGGGTRTAAEAPRHRTTADIDFYNVIAMLNFCYIALTVNVGVRWTHTTQIKYH